MTAEGSLSIESQHNVENVYKALKTLGDEIQQRNNKDKLKTTNIQ